MVHVIVVLVTISLLTLNLVPKTRAYELTDSAHDTILAELIREKNDVFGEFEEKQQLIVETFDQEATISNLQQTYLDNLSIKAQPRVDMHASNDEIDEDIVPSIQGGTSIVKPELAETKKSKKPRTKIVEYEVRGGDTISTIAQEFGISVNTILWANDLNAYSIIRPGDFLDILPYTGVVHTVAKNETISSIAKKYNVEEKKLLEANKIAKGETLRVSQELLVPGGKKQTYAVHSPTTYTGISAIRDFVKAPNAQPASGNKMNWPTEGGVITQYYSWRHYAVDIANKIGTPIYAADAGTIERAGWGTGYGNQIVIDHGGGKKTRYAHLSKFYVKKGDKVNKGQTIAAMGSTGWSTGPHLHFEVIINGKKYNPLDYIK